MYKIDVKMVIINPHFFKHILCSGFITKAIKYNSNVMIIIVRIKTNKFYSTFASTVHVMLQKKWSISVRHVYFRRRVGNIQISCKVTVYQKYKVTDVTNSSNDFIFTVVVGVTSDKCTFR